MKLFAKILIVFGGICLLFASYILWERNNPWRLAFQIDTHIIQETVPTLMPERIVITNLHIDLPIVPAKLSKETWQVSNTGVSYLISTPAPGELGNAILYGHNYPNLLANLSFARPGDKVEIYYPHTKKTFAITTVLEVSPKQADILKNTKDSRITLYTCSGFLDSKRLVVVAQLQ